MHISEELIGMEYKNVYVILFGAEKFRYLPERNVSNDFRALTNLFRDKFDYQLRILFGNSFSRQSDWTKAIDELSRQITRDDIVIVYYIGHVIDLIRQNRMLYYAATPIGRRGSKKGGLDVDWILMYPQKSLKARAFLFVFDSYIGDFDRFYKDDTIFKENNLVYVLSIDKTNSLNTEKFNKNSYSLLTHFFIKIMTDAYYLHKNLDVEILYKNLNNEILNQTNSSYGIQLFRHNNGSDEDGLPLNLFRKGKYPEEITDSFLYEKGSREDGVIRLGQLLTDSAYDMRNLARQSLEYISQNDISDDVRIAALRAMGIFQEKDNIDRQLIESEFLASDYINHIPALLTVPAGNFVMGCDNPSMPSEESPQHVLYLPEYQISKTQITNLQYIYFVINTGYKLPYHWSTLEKLESILDHPVVNVSWYDAIAYCNWLTNKLRSLGFIEIQQLVRLPSEAQWEKVARGDDGLRYPWGENFMSEFCNFSDNNIEGTTPVEKYPQAVSPYGCLDLAGNTWEWTISLWGTSLHKCQFTYPYDPSDGRENMHADEKFRRVIRGGGYYYGAECVTGYTRNHFRPNTYHTAGSFRVALIRRIQ